VDDIPLAVDSPLGVLPPPDHGLIDLQGLVGCPLGWFDVLVSSADLIHSLRQTGIPCKPLQHLLIGRLGLRGLVGRHIQQGQSLLCSKLLVLIRGLLQHGLVELLRLVVLPALDQTPCLRKLLRHTGEGRDRQQKPYKTHPD